MTSDAIARSAAIAFHLRCRPVGPRLGRAERGRLDPAFRPTELRRRLERHPTHPVTMIYSDPTCTDFEDTQMLAACPYFRQVLDTFQAPLGAVRLMRLTPGSVIKEHNDMDLSFEEGTVRIHVRVVTNAGVEFYLNRSRVVLDAGSAWYLRLSDPHSVANRGSSDRVHMVIDAEVNDWVADVLALASSRLQR